MMPFLTQTYKNYSRLGLDVECGDLSPLLTARPVAPQRLPAPSTTAGADAVFLFSVPFFCGRGAATDRRVKSGGRPPHSTSDRRVLIRLSEKWHETISRPPPPPS
jgi:hypothetical protein